MKRFYIFVAIFILFSATTFAQNQSRLALLAIDFPSSDAELMPEAVMLTDSLAIQLSATYGKLYNIERVSNTAFNLSGNFAAVDKALRDAGYTRAFQPKITRLDGYIKLSLLLWTKGVGRIEIPSNYSIDNVLRFKDIRDEALVAAVSALGSETINSEFVVFKFNNKSLSGVYEVWVNSSNAGVNIKEARISRGKYVIEVWQKRIGEKYYKVFSKEYNALTEEEVVSIDFSFPELTTDDIMTIYAQAATAESFAYLQDTARAETEFKKLFELLNDSRTPYSLKKLLAIYQAQYNEWRKSSYGFVKPNSGAVASVTLPVAPAKKAVVASNPWQNNPFSLNLYAKDYIYTVQDKNMFDYNYYYGGLNLYFDGYKTSADFFKSISMYFDAKYYPEKNTISANNTIIRATEDIAFGYFSSPFMFKIRAEETFNATDLGNISLLNKLFPFYGYAYLGSSRPMLSFNNFDIDEVLFAGILAETVSARPESSLSLSGIGTLGTSVKMLVDPSKSTSSSYSSSDLITYSPASYTTSYYALGAYVGVLGLYDAYGYYINPSLVDLGDSTTNPFSASETDRVYAQAGVNMNEIMFNIFASNKASDQDVMNTGYYGRLTLNKILPSLSLELNFADLSNDAWSDLTSTFSLPTLYSFDADIYPFPGLTIGASYGTINWDFNQNLKVANYLKIVNAWSAFGGKSGDTLVQRVYTSIYARNTIIENLNLLVKGVFVADGEGDNQYTVLEETLDYNFTKNLSINIYFSYTMYSNSAYDSSMYADAKINFKL